MSDEIATHDPPGGANFLIYADLADHGMPGRGEQLWARKLDDGRFVMRSLPFFVYGVALDDEVETDSDYVLKRVVKPSGHRLLRIAAQPSQADRVHDVVHPVLEAMRLPHEWHRVGYVVVDVEPSRDVSDLIEAVQPLADRGDLFYEFA